MVRKTVKDICWVAFRKIRLPFFIIAAAILLAGIYSWAADSMMASCSIPSIPGLNAPTVVEEKARNEEPKSKDEVKVTQAQDVQLQTAQVTVKTLYSR